MIAIAVFFLFLPAIIIGVIVGIVKAIKTPTPPAGSSRAYLNWWYNGGWKEAQRLEELERLIEEDKKRLNEDVREYLKAGEKMEAIKRYKDYHECSIIEAKTAIADIEWELEYERYRAEKDATDGLVDVQPPVSLDTMPNRAAMDAHDTKRKESGGDVTDGMRLGIGLAVTLVPFLGLYLVLKKRPYTRGTNIICIIYCIMSCIGLVVAILGSQGLIPVS